MAPGGFSAGEDPDPGGPGPGADGIPKSPGSLRDIDLLKPAREALVAQKALSWLQGGYVFQDYQQRLYIRNFSG